MTSVSIPSLLGFLICSFIAFTTCLADEAFDFDVAGQAALWNPNTQVNGLMEGIAIGGTETVATAADVTGNTPHLRYNTNGANSALWLTPGNENWVSVQIRMRLLDGNPEVGGTQPKAWPAGDPGVRFSLNENQANPLLFESNSGWTVEQQQGGWVLLTQDISTLTDKTVIKMRIDPLASSDSSDNFEIDFIKLFTDEEEVPPPSRGPNIVYIIVDDMGYSDLGCYGGEIDTPHIDSLATQGIKFRQYYNNAKCETTRTSIMTGLYHGRGVNTSGGATLAEALKTVDYKTYAVGKWHLGLGANIPVRQGFDHFYGFYGGASRYFPSGIVANTIKRDTAEADDFISAYPDNHYSTQTGTVSNQTTFPNDYYMTDSFGDNAVAFIQDAVTNHPDQPFFLYLAFNAPHTPLQAPVALINKYRNTYSAKGWDQMREEKWERQKALGLIDEGWQLPHLRDDIPRWSNLTAAEKDQEDHRRAVYAAMMDSVDQNVGKVIQQLTASGVENDTLIIFTGDNGAQAFDNTPNRNVSPSDPDSLWSMGPAWAAFSNTPFRYYKQAQQQGGICTPFVARWPETIAPGTITDQPGHVVDVMATFVDISGADYDSLLKDDGNSVPPMDGKSLLPILEGNERPAPDFWGFEHTKSEFAVIQGDWKLAAFSSSPWRLYNLKEDRTETRNLRWDYPEKVRDLAALYDQWATDTYGNTTRTYAERDTRSELSQELRYTKVLGGGIFQQPGVDITLSNIGSGNAATVNDHWEFYLTNTSASGLDGSSDSVTFANKRFFGDGTVIVQVESMSNMEVDGNAGLMIRESLDADSPFISIGITPSGQLVQSIRHATGATMASSIPVSSLSTPIFFKLTREANNFTASYSIRNAQFPDHDLVWVDLAAVGINMGMDVFAGFATASGDNGTRGTVTFREWEHRDVVTYPLSSRRIDGISEYLAYAFGIGSDTYGLSALPTFEVVDDSGNSYPEFHFNRRIGFDPAKIIVQYLGNDLSLRDNDTNAWTIENTAANPDGISESVILRRNNEVGLGERSFYRLGVQP